MSNILKKYNNLSITLKASIWFVFCSFMQKGISIITTPIFTRLMNATEFGKYNVFNSWENIIIIFVSLHIAAGAYTQGLIKYESNQKKYSSSMIGLTIVLYFCWFILYIVFRDGINNLLSMKTSYMIVMFICMFMYSIFAFWSSEQRVNYNYKKLVIITILSTILNPALGIVLMNFIEDKVFARILGTCIAWTLSYIWIIFKQLYSGKLFYSKFYWLHALKFNIPLIPHYLSQTILNSSDKIMIDKMIGNSQAGIYGLAYSVSLTMTLFNNALSHAITPWIYKKIRENKISDISNISNILLLIIAFLNILLIAFAPEVIKLFAPGEYYEAIYVIPPIAMSVYFMFLYELFSKFEFYFEKTKLIAVATFLGAIINLILNFLFIKIYGYIAAGYTTLVCYMLYSIFHYIFMRKICKENCNNVQPYDIKKCVIITIIFLLISFIFLFLYNHLFIRYVFILILVSTFICKKHIIIDYIKKIIQ